MYYLPSVFFGVKLFPLFQAGFCQRRERSGGTLSPAGDGVKPEARWAPVRGKAFPSRRIRGLPRRGSWCLLGAVPLDRYTSALEQVQPMITQHEAAAWSNALDERRPATSRSEQELATMLLAVNYELLGYPPEHAWLLAQRGEGAAPGRLDG